MNVLRHVSNLRAAQLKLRRPLAARPVLGHEIDPLLGFEKGLVLLQTVARRQWFVD